MPYSVPAEVAYSVSAFEYSTKTPCYTTEVVTEFVVLTNYVTTYGYPASTPGIIEVESVDYTPVYSASTPDVIVVQSVPVTSEYAASTPGSIFVESIPYTPVYSASTPDVIVVQSVPVTSEYSVSTPGVIGVESVAYTPEYSASVPGFVDVESVAYTSEYVASTPTGFQQVESIAYTPSVSDYPPRTPIGSQGVESIAYTPPASVYIVSTPTGFQEVESVAFTPSTPAYAASTPDTPGTEDVDSVDVPDNSTTTTVVESVVVASVNVSGVSTTTTVVESLVVASVDVPVIATTTTVVESVAVASVNVSGVSTTSTVVGPVVVASVIYTSEFSTSIPPTLESSAGPPGDLGAASVAYTPPAADYSAGPPGSVGVESIALTPEVTPTTFEYSVSTPGSIAVESIAFTPPPPASSETASYSEGVADAPSQAVAEVISTTTTSNISVASASTLPPKDITEVIEGLSDCAQTIVFESLANSKCTPTDFPCICGQLEYLDVAQLVAGTCTNTEVAQYDTFEQDTCAGSPPGPSSIVLLNIPTGGASIADIPLFTPEPEAEDDETTTVGSKVTTTKTVKSYATLGGYATASISVEEFTGAADVSKAGRLAGAVGFVGFLLARL